MNQLLFRVKTGEHLVKTNSLKSSPLNQFIDIRLQKKVKAVKTLSNITTHTRARTRAPREMGVVFTVFTPKIQLPESQGVTW